MPAEELRVLLRAIPFKPFTVHLSGDKAFVVPHKEYALLTPKGGTLVVSHKDKEAVDLLEVASISRIEVHDPAASGT
jgi:hypothetical protein